MSARSAREVIEASGAAFGTSGVRGLVEDLDTATSYAFTAAFLHHIGPAHGTDVWVGHDLRPSSPHIASAVLAAIRDAGLVPRFAGVIATPALAFTALRGAAPAVMVTGSHIPFDRNGIKFYRADGELTKADEAPIVESPVTVPALPRPAPLPDAEAVAHTDWHERYTAAFPGLLAGWRIGHWQHSASGRDATEKLLRALGARVIVLDRTDTFVPIDTEAVAQADRDRATAWAREHGFDMLVSTDGDGDRPLVAGPSGAFLRGDALCMLTARALGVRHLAVPVSCTTAIERSGWFDTVRRTRIGSPHVLEALAGLPDPAAGFEANGGFLLGSMIEVGANALDPLPTRDSILPMLAVAALARREGLSLDELAATLPARTTLSDRLTDIARKRSTSLMVDLVPSRLHPHDAALSETDRTDGVRHTFEDGAIVHLRPSGNAPELRVYVEAGSPSDAERLLSHALQATRDAV